VVLGARERDLAIGGQAVIEGVMMRGPEVWAVAVRRADGSITTETHAVAGWSQRYRALPLVRGVAALAESLGLGYRALGWSAEQQLDELDGPRPSKRAFGLTMKVSIVIAIALVLGAFVVLPALVGGIVHDHFGASSTVVESVIRLGLLVGYLAAVGLMKEIRRVFEYHGAEHKAIAAFERGAPLEPESAQRFTTAHVRCGTNFLLVVTLVAIVVYALVPTPNLLAVVVSRIVLLPLIAGLAYELIKLASHHMERRSVQVLMAPGLALQRLTTRQPSLEQLEVAIVALRAAMTDDQRVEVDARVAA
jgi:uncharacterized protein YqhQ